MLYAAVVAWVLRRARRGRAAGRAIPHQHLADLVRPDGRQSGAPIPPARRGRFRLRTDGPAIVIGEVHHPVTLAESPTPEWLTIPERGLYTGVAIFGAVGSGKTSACMHPFAHQLLSWHADDPDRRVAALVLEVKGDFCHDIRRMLTELGRADDYIELSLDGRLTWNPLSATWLDAYSLAYTVASLLNQLFGKGKEPFWQQAYTNLVRWIIELYRVLPPQDGSDTPGWVTLRDVYHCAIDKALFAKKIEQAQTYAKDARRRVDHRSADALSRPQPRAARHRLYATPRRPGTDARAGDAGRDHVPHRPHDHVRP